MFTDPKHGLFIFAIFLYFMVSDAIIMPYAKAYAQKKGASETLLESITLFKPFRIFENFMWAVVLFFLGWALIPLYYVFLFFMWIVAHVLVLLAIGIQKVFIKNMEESSEESSDPEKYEKAKETLQDLQKLEDVGSWASPYAQVWWLLTMIGAVVAQYLVSAQ